MHPAAFTRFGVYLKNLRELRNWPMERLARALGTDRGNVHRLESGRARPRYETVERLVRALEASPDEKTQLFERAGYQAPIWPTTQDDFEPIAKELNGRWLSDAPPATLITDVYWTVWYANEAFARLFTNRKPADLLGCHFLAICLDPSYGAYNALGRIASTDDIDDFFLLAVCRYKWRLASSVGDAGLTSGFSDLQRLSRFADMWRRAAREQHAPGDLLAAAARLRLREGEDILVHSATVRRDRRFSFTQFLPPDERIAATLSPYLRETSQ